MQSEPTITATWPEGSIPAATFADLLGISLAGLRLAVKNAAPPMARLQPMSPVAWPVVEAVLLELGFVKKAAAGGLEGLAGFSVADFVEKARGGAAAAPKAPALSDLKECAVIEPAADAVSFVMPKPAAPPLPVMAALVAQCPNPLFWRAKIMVERQVRMVTVKEPLAQKRARFRPGLLVKVWPMAFPADHFTTVAPKGGV